jgi:beta-lactam-binding protein with PASTA domain
VLLHGWPGDRTDHDALVHLLAPHAEVVVPDLRGTDLAEAVARVRALGLVPRQLLFGGHVLDQSPGPGSRVRRGSTVVLWRSPV